MVEGLLPSSSNSCNPHEEYHLRVGHHYNLEGEASIGCTSQDEVATIMTSSSKRRLEETSKGKDGLDDEEIPLVPIDYSVTAEDELGGVCIGGPTKDGDVERFTTTSR